MWNIHLANKIPQDDVPIQATNMKAPWSLKSNLEAPAISPTSANETFDSETTYTLEWKLTLSSAKFNKQQNDKEVNKQSIIDKKYKINIWYNQIIILPLILSPETIINW